VRVLGLDPGSRACGYGVVEIEAGRLRALDFGVWRSKPGTFSARLEWLFAQAEKLLVSASPDAAAIETVFSGKNVSSAVALSHARGVLLLAAARAGVPIFEYEPLTVKKTITGYGRAEKPQVREMVRSLLSVGGERLALDAADALAAAICHCHHQSSPSFDHRSAAC
jgi:crossover junction endodeoxyribonuclease RuvC